MANIMIYTVEPYSDKFYRTFAGVYNDFKSKAVSEYLFELEPLDYDDFVKYVKDELIQCLILFEDNIPTAFLAYTTVISESVELNIIHTINDENANHKRRLLIEKFLEVTRDVITQKVVTYPLLGKQADFVREITHYNFHLVGHSVVRFALNNIGSIKILKNVQLPTLDNQLTIADWDLSYFDRAVEVIHNAFKDRSDALFDTRFKSISGTRDIIEKITSSIYGEFLAKETKVLLYKDKPVGFCFANLTNAKIGNIPLVAVDKKFRGRGYSKILLHSCLDNIVCSAMNQGLPLVEVNASVDTENYPAIKMYRAVGFKEDYTYPQAFRPAG
ncbi:MAG: GNAT family N-acetyltransferase [Candidatus Gastranaerophilales bacterium]|nr:GNAT family N-acetyltransferase [Candidatus Gastranaerophilales bacterium]